MSRLGIFLCVAAHLLLLMSGVLLPYMPSEQNRSLSFASPSKLVWFDQQGRFGPFVRSPIKNEASDGTSRLFKVRWLKRSNDSGWVLFSTDSPNGAHLLGTDRYGRDVLSRTIYATRFSLFCGVAAATLAVLFGLTVAGISVLLGGVSERLAMFMVDTIQVMPWIFLLIAVRALLPLHLSSQVALLCTMLLVGLLAMAYPARLARSAMRSAANEDFVKAAVGFGAPRAYVLFKHLVPFARDRLLTHWALLIPNCVMAEVMLSYFGLGAEDAWPSLGNLLSDLTEPGGATSHPWLYAPVVILALAVLSYHLLAEALRPNRQ